MPHSSRALITLHRETLDGRVLEAGGILCPLEIPILFDSGPKVWQTIQVGRAWRFFNGSRGIEAEIYIDEDSIPEASRGQNLYPGVDILPDAINGEPYRKVIVQGRLQAIHLDLGSPWEEMPAIYWPLRFAPGTAPVSTTSDNEWLPGKWSTER